MFTTEVVIAGLATIVVGGAGVWSWHVVARIQRLLGNFDDLEGMHFER